MEGCGSWTDLLNGCLGRERMTEDDAVEMAPPRNPYGRKLMERLEESAARQGNPVARSQADHPEPLPSRPSAIAHLGKPETSRRPSEDLGDLVDNDDDEAREDMREYDSAWYEMLDSLHDALKHTRYSISGRMGMSVWRCSRGARDALSVICPTQSKEAVKLWVISTGGRFALSNSEPDILTFRSQGSCGDGCPRLWRIRIRWLPERVFEAMPKTEMRLVNQDGSLYDGGRQVVYVNVLTLPALLDNCASAWVSNLNKGVSQEQLEVVAQDIDSILDRIMELHFREEGSGSLSAGESRHILDRAFWTPFTRRHPLAPTKFAQCGLGLPSYTQHQPSPLGGMVYLETTPISHPFGRAGRSLMARQSAPERHRQTEATVSPFATSEQPMQEATPGGSSSPKVRKKTRAGETGRDRHERGDAKRPVGHAARREARKLEEREKDRMSERRAQRGQKQEGRRSKSQRSHIKRPASKA